MNEPVKLPPVISVPAKETVPPAEGPSPGGGRPHQRVRLHPFSGVLILAIDTLFFGAEAISLGLALPVTCLLAFAVTGTGVYLAQRHLDDDSRGTSLAKSFFAGVLAGIPTSISGTILGTMVLLMSGMSALNRKNP